MAGSVVVRSVRADEVARYRALRLAALEESPAAFTATFAEEAALPESAWATRVQASLEGASAVVVADAGRELVGLAVGIPWGTRARVVSVWVGPDWRRRGLAETLIEMVCDWAAAAAYTEVQIETAIANPGPQSLYEKLGFVAVDEDPPARCGPVLVRRLVQS